MCINCARMDRLCRLEVKSETAIQTVFRGRCKLASTSMDKVRCAWRGLYWKTVKWIWPYSHLRLWFSHYLLINPRTLNLQPLDVAGRRSSATVIAIGTQCLTGWPHSVCVCVKRSVLCWLGLSVRSPFPGQFHRPEINSRINGGAIKTQLDPRLRNEKQTTKWNDRTRMQLSMVPSTPVSIRSACHRVYLD